MSPLGNSILKMRSIRRNVETRKTIVSLEIINSQDK